MMGEKHTFVICAYKESPYLRSCIQSLKKQTEGSRILIATSTPNRQIQQISEECRIPLYVNEGDQGIVQDWNFALGLVQTKYATIAHQDDVYHKRYTEMLLKMMEKAEKPLIFFSDYGEIREGVTVVSNTLLNVKRLMLFPLLFARCWESRFIRRRILSFGSPICCPSVGFAMEHISLPVFEPGFRSNEDWQAWEKISREKGSFIYCRRRLVYHRIHEESATSRIISDTGRKQEDLTMFRKFWPYPVARMLAKIYGRSEKSNVT